MDKNIKIALILSAVDKMTAVVDKAISRSSKAIDAFNKKANSFADSAFGFGRTTGAIGLATFGALAGPFKAAADMEKMNVALRTSFQGNQQAAESAFQTINTFAAKTPYELGEVMTAFIKLKNMGLDPSNAALESYGNTASSMGKGLNDMIEAVADAATGEFERLKEFGIKASSQGNQVKFTFQGVTTTVAKNSASIEKYLMKIGQTKFAGGMEAQSKTAYGQLSTLTDNVKMLAANIGKSLIPAFNNIVAKITPILTRVQEWIDKNPKLVENILMGAAAFGALMLATSGISFAVGGIIKTLTSLGTVLKYTINVIGFVGKAVMFLGRMMLANPILLIITAIAVAAFLIYKYWDQIKAFFIRLWAVIKSIFSAAWQWIKNLFLNYTPTGLIIKHWSKITAFFSSLWEKVKGIFSAAWEWVVNLGTKFYDAGKNIITSIWEGIKAMVNKPIQAVKDMVTKIREYLPFSPAKVGPLRDIHRVKIAETIAQSIKVQPVMDAMNKVGNAVFNGINNNAARPLPVAVNNGGASYNFQVTLNGGATQDQANMVSGALKNQVLQVIKDEERRKQRVTFGG